MVKKAATKKAWVPFEITKVKLNPEQAVLSCCTGASYGARGPGGPGGGCDVAYSCGGPTHFNAQSS